MPNFKIEGSTADGQVRETVIEAADEADARAKATSSGLFPITVSETRRRISSGKTDQPLTPNQIKEFLEDMELGIAIGMTPDVVMGDMAAHHPTPVVRDVCRRIASEPSLSFADSVKKTKKFSPIVEGAFGAQIPVQQAVAALQKHYNLVCEFSRELKQLAAKPALVVLLIIGVAALFVFKMSPASAEMFDNFDAPYPPLLRAEMAVYHACINYWFVVAAALTVTGCLVYKNFTAIRIAAIRLLDEIPWIRKFNNIIRMALFARVIATIASTGNDYLPILHQLRAISANTRFAPQLDRAINTFNYKSDLTAAMEEITDLDSRFVYAIRNGVKNAALAKSADRTADAYLAHARKQFTTLSLQLEFANLIIAGSIIALLVIADLMIKAAAMKAAYRMGM